MRSTESVYVGVDEVARVYDVIGVGLGPANLALAAAFEDDRRRQGIEGLSVTFLEARDEFVWHKDLLLPEARCQVSIFKDLATFRDPCSSFTFMNYLFCRGRLAEFANLRDITPSRNEFNDYFRWAADRLEGMIRYRQEVATVRPLMDRDGRVRSLRVVARDPVGGRESEYVARDLVVATGAVPVVPPGVALEPRGRTFHSAEFLSRIEELCPDREARYEMVIVGSGQSAADIMNCVLDRYPKAQLTVAMRQFAFRPLDDSPFVNELFDPEMIERVYEMLHGTKAKLLRDHWNTGYRTVDADLLDRLYARLYQDRVLGCERAQILRLHELVHVQDDPWRPRVRLSDVVGGREVDLEADVVILATGYAKRRRLPLLSPLERFFELDDRGEYALDRNYRIKTAPGFHPQIIMQGFAEDTHGISDAQLSNLAFRAGWIQKHLREHRSKDRSSARSISPATGRDKEEEAG